MYRVRIRYGEYQSWKVCNDWFFDSMFTGSFDDYIMDRYPEVLKCIAYPVGYREFTFESESYYHWFLLQVM